MTQGLRPLRLALTHAAASSGGQWSALIQGACSLISGQRREDWSCVAALRSDTPNTSCQAPCNQRQLRCSIRQSMQACTAPTGCDTAEWSDCGRDQEVAHAVRVIGSRIADGGPQRSSCCAAMFRTACPVPLVFKHGARPTPWQPELPCS